MNTYYVTIMLAAVAPATAVQQSFEDFVMAFDRPYAVGSKEFEQRRALFDQRMQYIEEQNARPNRLWTAGINHLTDQTEEELRMLRGWRRAGSAEGQEGVTALLAERADRHGPPNATVDWTHLDAFSRVANQGACGSCWAVSAATVMSAHHEIHMKQILNFSPQQLVDCVQNPKKCGGSGGCDGATVELAFDYALRSGLSDTLQVPYTARDQSCASAELIASHGHGHSHNKQTVLADDKTWGGAAFGLQGYSKLPENSAGPLMQALMDGPVSISVAASAWGMYSHGIFDSCEKDAEIDHAVVMVGYGKDNQGNNYWNVQNSWGGHWGERGHIRIFRHDTVEEEDAYCGIDHDPSVGTACEPYPESVQVCGMCGILYDSVAPHFEDHSGKKRTHMIKKLRGGQ